MYSLRSVLGEVHQKTTYSLDSHQLSHESKSFQYQLSNLLVLACATTVFIATSVGTGVNMAMATRPDLPESARSQIQSLILEKQNRTPGQTKLSSRLLHAWSMKNGKSIAQDIRTLRSGVQIARDGTTEVDIKTDISNTLLAQIESLGGTIINQHPSHQTLRVRININQIESLANFPQIHFIQPAVQMIQLMLCTACPCAI